MSSLPHIPYQEMSFFCSQINYLKAPQGNILLSIMDGFQGLHGDPSSGIDPGLLSGGNKAVWHRCTNFNEWINRAFVPNRHLPGFNTYILQQLFAENMPFETMISLSIFFIFAQVVSLHHLSRRAISNTDIHGISMGFLAKNNYLQFSHQILNFPPQNFSDISLYPLS